ncbi:MAG: hypothetical protein AABY22_34680 [Nanoarchaeota archaeon]
MKKKIEKIEIGYTYLKDKGLSAYIPRDKVILLADKINEIINLLNSMKESK